MEPWNNDSLNWLIHRNLVCSCRNETIQYSNRASCTDKSDQENHRRPSFSWCYLPHREKLPWRCHDQVDHLGLECMLDLMHDQFFWPCMAAQAKEHIRKCHLCLAFKAKQPKAPLENIMATHPLELVYFDYLCLEPEKGIEENVLVVTDHFTRYAQVYITRTQTTAKTLQDKFIVYYGLPRKILSDQGQNFQSQLVTDLCEMMWMQKIWTSLYHPQTNSQCERFNSTLINMLGM